MSKPRRTSSRRVKSSSTPRKDDLDLKIPGSRPQTTETFGPGLGGLIDRFNALTPSSRMYYVKLLFGAVFGVFVGNLPLEAPSGGWIFGLLIAVIALAIACVVVRFGLKISEDALNNRRLILNGTFSFVMIFLVMWVVFWQLGNLDISLVNLILGRSEF